MSLPDADWSALIAYSHDEASPEEAARVRTLLVTNPRAGGVLQELQVLRDVCVRADGRFDSDAALVAVRQRIDTTAIGAPYVARGRSVAGWSLPSRERVSGRGPIGNAFVRRGVWPMLAVMSGVAIVAGLYVGHQRGGVSVSKTVSTYTTANGQRANITLPDGSTVALGVASRLDVPADYLAGDHRLRLSGEAVFTVRHHGGVPFAVSAGATTTRVLGTSFLVRHYDTDRSTTVAVRDGKVAVGSAMGHPIVLTEAQEVEIDSLHPARVRPADPARFSFATGVLTLKSVPLADAIPELNRWYNADIRLGDPALRTQRIMGECAAGSLSDLVELLEGTFNVRVVRSGRVLTLFPR